MEYLGTIEFILGIIAIWLAVVHERGLRHIVADLKAQSDTLKAQADALKGQSDAVESASLNLKEIKEATSTKYLDKFPECFSSIVDLIKGAKATIEIFCDFPAYGSFSNHRVFLDYRNQLGIKQDEGLAISVICLDQVHRTAMAREQFTADWESREAAQHFKAKLLGFLARHDKKESEVSSLDLFLEVIEKENTKMLGEFRKPTQVTQVGRHMPLFFWLVDGHSAVFSIASLATVEYGFATKDARLIGALQSMRDLYAKSA